MCLCRQEVTYLQQGAPSASGYRQVAAPLVAQIAANGSLIIKHGTVHTNELNVGQQEADVISQEQYYF